MSIPLIYKEEVAETITIKRTQRIHIPYNEMVSYFCHLSKNLWNQAHHLVYGYYQKTRETNTNGYGNVPSYEELDGIMNKKSYKGHKKDGVYFEEYDNYHKLGGSTSQQILRVYIKSWISYLKGIKGYYGDSNSDKNYTGKPRKPGYKKKDGEFELIFTNKQIKFIEKKDGSVWMTFLKKIDGKKSKLANLKILLGNVNNDGHLINRLAFGKFDQVRLVPKGTGYWIEIVYDQEVAKNAHEIYKLNEDIIMSIDLGVEILCAITDIIGNRPIIIKSEILKAKNQWYNKRKSELQEIYDRQKIGCYLKKDGNGNIRYIVKKTGKKLDILTENRNNFVMDTLHKISRYIVERALDIKAMTIAFVRNIGWKQKVKMGKRNNQNFVQIPHKKLIDMTRYKAQEYGINVIDDTEEYTSKCSFPDSEDICFHKKYMGKRIYRGLFEASKGWKINADVDGSYNFLRKIATRIIKNKTKFDYVYPKFDILDIIEGIVDHGLVPKRLSISDLLTKNYKSLS